MGRPGRRAGTHAELARAPVTRSRGSTWGGFPHLPLACDAKVEAATMGGRPRHRPGRTRQWEPCSPPFCPCAALTAHLQPKSRIPAQAKVHLGFSHSCVRRRRERRAGEWGKKRISGKGEAAPCDTVGVPIPEAVHVRRESYPSRWEELKPTALGGEPEQRKEQGAAVNTYTAPPSSTGR
jgi:hypothetical protein